MEPIATWLPPTAETVALAVAALVVALETAELAAETAALEVR